MQLALEVQGNMIFRNSKMIMVMKPILIIMAQDQRNFKSEVALLEEESFQGSVKSDWISIRDWKRGVFQIADRQSRWICHLV